MDFLQTMLNSPWFSWVVLPLLIFFARIADVTIGTIRIIMISKGNKLFSPLLGFFEVLIWLLAIGQIMQNLNNVFAYIAYAGGFAAGNYVGIRIEEKLAIGTIMIRMIIKDLKSDFVSALRSRNYGVTILDAQGSQGSVNILYCTIKRSNLFEVVRLINEYHPKAFYSVEDVRLVREGIFPHHISGIRSRFRNSMQHHIKQK